MAHYEKDKDIYIQRKKGSGFEEVPLIVHPDSILSINSANDLVTISTASFNTQVSTSYAISSSYSLNAGSSITTGSNYPITSSWSENSIFSETASYAYTSSYELEIEVSTSFASASISSSYATSASYVPDLYPVTSVPSSSWASSSVSASYAPFNPMYSASVALTKQDTLITGNTYTITSSWSNNASNASNVIGNVTGSLSGSNVVATQANLINLSVVSKSLFGDPSSFIDYGTLYPVMQGGGYLTQSSGNPGLLRFDATVNVNSSTANYRLLEFSLLGLGTNPSATAAGITVTGFSSCGGFFGLNLFDASNYYYAGTGTLTNYNAFASLPRIAGSGNVTNVANFRGYYPRLTSTGTPTNVYGITMENMQGGTNSNTNINIGTVPSTGSYSIYNNSTYPNYFGGPLDVSGNISCSVITASLNGNANTATSASSATSASYVEYSNVKYNDPENVFFIKDEFCSILTNTSPVSELGWGIYATGAGSVVRGNLNGKHPHIGVITLTCAATSGSCVFIKPPFNGGSGVDLIEGISSISGSEFTQIFQLGDLTNVLYRIGMTRHAGSSIFDIMDTAGMYVRYDSLRTGSFEFVAGRSPVVSASSAILPNTSSWYKFKMKVVGTNVISFAINNETPVIFSASVSTTTSPVLEVGTYSGSRSIYSDYFSLSMPINR